MIRHSLADAIFWLAAASCLVAQIAILRSALMAPLEEPSTPGMPRARRGVEVAWTILPAIALAVLLVFTWRAIHARRGPHATGFALRSAPSLAIDRR